MEAERIGRPLAALLSLGYLLAAVLLARLAYDLGREYALIGVLVWTFYACFLAVGWAQHRAIWYAPDLGAPLARPMRGLLALAVPVGLFGSIFDCMGLSLAGCSPTCGFLTRVLVPAIGVSALVHGFTEARAWIVGGFLVSFGLLVPNCVCYNPINAFWIDALGRSPACFASGFTVVLVATSALLTRRYAIPSLLFVWGTIGAVMTFFVGHHYFDWPW